MWIFKAEMTTIDSESKLVLMQTLGCELVEKLTFQCFQLLCFNTKSLLSGLKCTHDAFIHVLMLKD